MSDTIFQEIYYLIIFNHFHYFLAQIISFLSTFCSVLRHQTLFTFQKIYDDTSSLCAVPTITGSIYFVNDKLRMVLKECQYCTAFTHLMRNNKNLSFCRSYNFSRSLSLKNRPVSDDRTKTSVNDTCTQYV